MGWARTTAMRGVGDTIVETRRRRYCNEGRREKRVCDEIRMRKRE